MRSRADHYARRAVAEATRSRAAYKLEEMDRKFRLLRRPGMRVLDLGASPGGWSLYAARRGCRVTAVDLLPMEPICGVRFVQRDVRDYLPSRASRGRGSGEEVKEVEEDDNDDEAAAARGFQLVLSDMAPNVSGDKLRDHAKSIALCREALRKADEALVPGGTLVLKLFRAGEDEPALVDAMEAAFLNVRRFKPRASRSASTELYFIATGFVAPGTRLGAA